MGIYKYLHFLLLFLFAADLLKGQDCLKDLERWFQKEKYRKIIRKSDKIIRQCHHNNDIYFFIAWAEAVEGEKRFPKTKGYNHLLRGLSYYELYTAELSSERKKALKEQLMNLARRYHSQFNAWGDTLSCKNLEKIVSSMLKARMVKFYGKNAEIRSKIVNEAIHHLGKPYRYGGKGPDSFDCSGFTHFVYRSAIGYNLPGSSESQAKIGSPVDLSEALPADLVFFGEPKSGKISHAAIVLEVEESNKLKIIHSTNRGVVIESTSEVGWENHWKGKLVQCVNIVDFIEGR